MSLLFVRSRLHSRMQLGAATGRTAVARAAVLALVLVLAVAAWPREAGAQDRTRPDTTRGPSVAAGEKGFALASADSTFVLRIGGALQVDGRFASREAADPVRTFALRRARPKFTVVLAEHYRLGLDVELTGGTASLKDAVVTANLSDDLSLKAGQFKMPVGLEFLQSGSHLLFAERAFPTGLVPRRDLGAMLSGTFIDDVLQVEVGIANGAVSGRDGPPVDPDAGKEGVARVFVRPVATNDFGVGLGAGATYGGRDGRSGAPQVPAFRTTGGQTFFRYEQDAGNLRGVRADGTLLRLVPQTYVHAGPFDVLAEYAFHAQDVAVDRPPAAGGPPVLERSTLRHRAWQVAASAMLTGENASFRTASPKQPLRETDGWGSVQVSARVEGIAFDVDAFREGFANRGTQAERATAVAAAVHWKPNAAARLTVSYTRTRAETIAGSALFAPEHAVVTRLQLTF